MNKSITKRIRITKTGKVIRRKMGIGHNGSRKTKSQKSRKINTAVFSSDAKAIKRLPAKK